MVAGEDLDNTDMGIGANGVGKSSLINALAYVIYDKTIGKLTVNELINNINGKEMMVTLTYKDKQGNACRIERYRKMKSSADGTGVKFTVNGTDVSSAGGTNGLIEASIGIPYELFVRMVVFSASHKPFLDLSESDQKRIIEELFGITVLTSKADHLKKEFISVSEAELREQKAVVTTLEAEVEKLANRLKDAQQKHSKWNSDYQRRRLDAQAKLDTLQNIDIDGQQQLIASKTSLQRDAVDIKSKVALTTREIQSLTTTITKLSSEIESLRNHTCPYCEQHLATSTLKAQHVCDARAKAEEQLLTKVEELDAYRANLFEVETRVRALSSQITTEDVQQLIRIRDQSADLRRLVSQPETNPYEEVVKELQSAAHQPIDYTTVNKLTRDIDHYKLLHKLLYKSDSFVRKTVLDKNLTFLNQRLKTYVAELGLPHSVSFTNTLDINVTRFGKAVKFTALSGGQRARVNFALALAFWDVQLRYKTRINVCFLDEVLDHGLDTIGIQAAARLVKQKARSEQIGMFVISHRDEISGTFDSTVVVQMKQGFSTLIG
jgi:DNA repair exonuclease SbcCD ATPase subunit